MDDGIKTKKIYYSEFLDKIYFIGTGYNQEALI